MFFELSLKVQYFDTLYTKQVNKVQSNIINMATTRTRKIKGKTKGRLIKAFPSGLDVSALEYLQYGDLSRVAKEAGVSVGTVKNAKTGRTRNFKILGLLIKQGIANKNLAEAQ